MLLKNILKLVIAKFCVDKQGRNNSLGKLVIYIHTELSTISKIENNVQTQHRRL